VCSQWAAGVGGENYVDFVWQAVANSSVFASFRRNPTYTRVLEHVPERIGRAYLDSITDPLIREICFSSEFADTVGLPEVKDYEGRKISPTTLRYGKVLQDLVNYFPSLLDMYSIVEIGVGYGGQARMISEYIRRKGGRLRNYNLVDLLPVLHLSRMYLEHFDLAFEVKYLTKSEAPKAGSYDLAISNYAFSELFKPLQRQYLDLVLLRSRGGYLTMNTGLRGPQPFPRPGGADWHAAEELMAILPKSVVLDETPNTGAANYLLIFGQHDVSRPTTLEAIATKAQR